MSESRTPFPPFDLPAASQKAQAAEDAWNTRDPERVALAYTPDSTWRNRDAHIVGRDRIVEFLTRMWEHEQDYALRKGLWGFRVNLKAATADTEPLGQRAERALDLLEHGLRDYAVSPPHHLPRRAEMPDLRASRPHRGPPVGRADRLGARSPRTFSITHRDAVFELAGLLSRLHAGQPVTNGRVGVAVPVGAPHCITLRGLR